MPAARWIHGIDSIVIFVYFIGGHSCAWADQSVSDLCIYSSYLRIESVDLSWFFGAKVNWMLHDLVIKTDSLVNYYYQWNRRMSDK